MIKEAIKKVVEGGNLEFSEARTVFLEIFNEVASVSQVASLLVGLRMKNETADEIAGAASVVREKAIKINVRDKKDEPIVDTCGTGGSGVEKFNISTATAFVVSSSGVKVAKHGNRAASSFCGSADVLEVMGIKIDAPPEVMEEAIRKIGIGFLFAPLYHKAFKVVVPIRKEIGIRTLFNIVGPLCNPASADYQLLGVSDVGLVVKMAQVLKKLGAKRAFVFFGDKLKDEISLLGRTKVAFLDKKKIKNFYLTPASFGLKKCRLKDLEAKSAAESAKKITDIFEGIKGPARDVVLANAAVCFYMLKKARTPKEGVRLAARLIDQGDVKRKYLDFKQFLENNG
ncbi:MAG: anthranilate phosphoribosyltransferase [Candidatus Omnitrophota bacterium]